MYEWQIKFTGYSLDDATKFLEDIDLTGGVGRIERREGMEMGSGPHFQGYYVHFIEPLTLRNHVDMPSQKPVDRERYRRGAQGVVGDDPCECGHDYYRHFDSYEPGLPHIGCKYCECGQFQEYEQTKGV